MAHRDFFAASFFSSRLPDLAPDFSTVNFGLRTTVLETARTFEDLGVRAPTLLPYKDVLQEALTIHSVEARHAPEVRRLRGNFMDQAPNKGWITGSMTDIPGTQAVDAGEANVVHGGINAASTRPR